jgi:sterol desaturase/sphingolipid hydroxylase (fatty acid hydroxylase superfamily)
LIIHLEKIAFLSPLAGVALFFLLDKLLLKDKNTLKNRIKTIISIETVNVFLSIVLSLSILVPLVFLIAPLQIFSFSNLDLPGPIIFCLSFLFLDFVSYVQHVLHHKIPVLWRIHRLHHSDRHMDALTTFLHHPLEVMSVFVFTISFAVIFDIPVIVMVIHSVVVGLHAPFTHIRKLIPEHIEKYLKIIMVTPNFHRVHHSLDMKEGNSNFGGVFVFWDYIFGTAISKKLIDMEHMKLGIGEEQNPDRISLVSFIKNPLS